jgi:hypothetical protein
VPFVYNSNDKGEHKMSRRYSKEEVFREKFYRLPKVFFTNDLYKKGLTDTEKIAFALLQDRFELSIKNGWLDENGDIYFIFSQSALMDVFNCSNKTASNIKKKLIQLDLLEVKKRGQGKTDLLYLNKPIVTDDDIYKIQKEEDRTDPEEKKEDRQTLGAVEKCKNDTSRNEKITRPEMTKSSTNDTDFKETDYNKTENISNLYSLEEEIQELNLPMRLKQQLKENREKIKPLKFDIYAFEKFYNQSPFILELASPDDINHLSIWEVQDMLHNFFKKNIVIESTTFGFFKKNTLTRLSMKLDNNSNNYGEE